MIAMLSRLIVAAGLLLAATSAAHADFITPLIALFTFISSLGVVGNIIFSVAASIGLSYLAKALAPKPSMPDISSLPGGTTGKLQAGGAIPRAFGVGRYMTAGSLVYANTYSPTSASTAATTLGSSTAAAGTTPNAYLVQVISLSDIPVTGLVGLFVNGAAATYNPATPAVFEGIPIPEYNKSGKDHLWVRFYSGAQVAADPALVQLFGTDPDRPYTGTRIGTGVAYAVVTALVNQDLFPGFPQFKFVLDGIKLYDRRYDSTAGGSGSQRWATPSTWALTSNNVVIAENILRGISYGGKWVYGAQTVAAAQLPYASWSAAASECDTAINLLAGGTEPQFRAGGEIRFDVEPANTLEELLKACNGRLAEVGGTYKVRAGAAGSAVFSFTDGDILSTEQQTFEPFPSLGQTINAVTAKYISPAEGWVPKDAPPLYDATLETADGGRRQPIDVNYGFVTSGTQVQRLMKAERDNHRAMRQHALPMPPEAFVLEPLDVISWTSTRNGYSAKLFEIVSAEDLPNLNMGLAIKELDPNAYDWTPGTDEQPITDGTIVIVTPPAQPVVSWAVIPWTITSDGIQSQAGIKLSWDATSDDVDGVLFEVRLTSSGEVVYRGVTDNYAAGSIIVSQNLLFNTAYQARGKYRPIGTRETSWSSWLGVTTADIRVTEAALDDQINNAIDDLLHALNDANNSLLNGIVGRSVNERLHELAESTVANILRTAQIENTLRSAGIDIDPDRGTVKLWALDRFQDDYAVASASLSASISAEGVVRAAADLLLGAAVNGKSSTITITIASPGVVTWPAHGFSAGQRVKSTTTGALPTGITAGTYYYVIASGLTADAFKISATAEGTAIVTSGSQSGVHTGTTQATNAFVSDEAVARVTQDSALAAQITTLNANYNSVSADASFRIIASSNLAGAVAAVDMQVTANSGVSWASAGLGLAAYAQPGGGHISLVRIFADLIELGTSDAGGNFTRIFGVQSVAGVNKVSILPDAFPDNVITERNITAGADEEIYKDFPADDTSTTGATFYQAGAGGAIASYTIPLQAGEGLDVDFQFYFDPAATSWIQSSGVCNFFLKVNGVTVDATQTVMPPGSGGTLWVPNRLRRAIWGLGAGDVTVAPMLYLSRGQAGQNSGNSVYCRERAFIVRRLKKQPVIAIVSLNASVSYIGVTYGGASGTFSGASIGAANANRVTTVMAAWHAADGTCPAWPTMTIGGVAAQRETARFEGYSGVAAFTLATPTGTTADIVATMPSNASDITILVHRVLSISPYPYFANNTTNRDAATGAYLSSWATAMAASANSVYVGAMAGNNASGGGWATGYAQSWGGAASITEDVDSNTSATDLRYAGYHATFSTAQSYFNTLSVSGGDPGGIPACLLLFR